MKGQLAIGMGQQGVTVRRLADIQRIAFRRKHL